MRPWLPVAGIAEWSPCHTHEVIALGIKEEGIEEIGGAFEAGGLAGLLALVDFNEPFFSCLGVSTASESLTSIFLFFSMLISPYPNDAAQISNFARTFRAACSLPRVPRATNERV